jgi:hypothetical protein
MMAWPAGRSREITDWLFHGPDEQARQYGWTVEIRHSGLSRRYRDPRFDSLAGANPVIQRSGPGVQQTATQSSASNREVMGMSNLLILIGAVLVAFRILGPLLRIIMSLLARLISFAFLIALSVIVLVALLSHGMFI